MKTRRASRRMETQKQPEVGKKRRSRAFKDISNAPGDRRREGGIEKKTRDFKEEPNSVAVPAGNQIVAKPPPRRRSKRIQRDQATLKKPSNYINGDTKNSYQYTGVARDIDSDDSDDPGCVVEYVNDMYSFFLEREQTSWVRPYMDIQPHINETMRSILVDWIIQVHLHQQMKPETLHLAVNVVDRFLERQEIVREHLQLVGIAAIFLASKYEEAWPMSPDELVHICDGAYDKSDLLDMEFAILNALEYKMSIPTAHTFLVRFLKAARADKELIYLSSMILDGTLLSSELLHFLPSQLAAASIAIARHAVGRCTWSPTLLKYAQCCEEEVLPVSKAILEEKGLLKITLSSPHPLRALQKKYSSRSYGGVWGTVLDLF